MADPHAAADSIYFSLIHGGPLYRFRRAVGLIPESGLGLAWRAVALVSLTWLPIMIGAIVQGEAFEGQGSDPLIRHFGIHARLLVALPLLLLAEASFEKLVPFVVRQFIKTGIVGEEIQPQFRKLLADAARLRDSIWGVLLVLGVAALVASQAFAPQTLGDELAWATPDTGAPQFAVLWYLLVARPVFAVYLAIWFWRSMVGWVVLYKTSKLHLTLVPTHPDHSGGLEFLQAIGGASAPLAFALTVVVAGRWGHEVMYHGVKLQSLYPVAVGYALLIVLILLGPLLLMAGPLLALKRRSLIQYGDLVGQHGRLTHEKWIEGRDIGEAPILDAPEIGCLADAAMLFESVRKIRIVPLGPRAIAPVALAILIPLVAVASIQVPLKEILKKILSALV